MPAGTVAWFSWNSPWLKWPWAPAGPQAQHAQDFMESMVITLAKLGSRGRQSKVNQWWPQELPVCRYSPRSPQGAAGLGWAHNPTCVHRDLGAQGRRGTAPEPPAVAVLSCLTVPFPGHRQEQHCTPDRSLHSTRVGWDFPWKECPATTAWVHDILHEIWGAEI